MAVSSAYSHAAVAQMSSKAKCAIGFAVVLMVLSVIFYPETFGLVEHIPVIYVVGFHHSGTSLLRHILGSHPLALEIAKEHKGNAITLQALRTEARGLDKKFVVVKVPVNNEMTLKNVRGVKDLQDVHFASIKRDRADLIYSLSKRERRNITDAYVKRVNDQIDGVWNTSFLRDVPSITLEKLSWDTQGTLEELCRHLPLPFHTDMLEYWKTPFPYDNQGHKHKTLDTEKSEIDPRSQHGKLRVTEINAPVHPSKHTWLSDNSLSPEQVEILRRYATY